MLGEDLRRERRLCIVLRVERLQAMLVEVPSLRIRRLSFEAGSCFRLSFSCDGLKELKYVIGY